ncbi:MAG: N-6 DNA methylase [Candidatus Poribacteria bacterium]|nr:N-6 DNA methylase [Candidatus Poribacteria bacterium]
MRSDQPAVNRMNNREADAVENRSLFSDYYLGSLITEHPQWGDTPDIESIYAEMNALYEAIRLNAEKLNEAQTEEDFIKPALELLGHAFEVQPSLQTSQGTKRPDYAFFASEAALNDAQPHVNTNALFKTAIAVGDAKVWSRDLDRKMTGRGNPFDNSNPSYQIDFYLRQTDKTWGILTNGRQWRLYNRQTSYRLDCFYQVDLSVILSGTKNLNAFRYFYCLFRRDAFLPDAEGRCFLDAVLAGSQQHTVGVSGDLKNRVYEALRLLIGGFLDHPRNAFDKTDPPLDEIHTNGLILLYRVLFILYAESRGLLPVENPDYAAHYSLAHLATEIHEKLDRGAPIIPTMTDYWARLRGLFALINDGWEDLIPQYNGGLFNPEQHPFLERHEFGNDVLAKVIDLLTRTKDGERITYRDLEVRHLGSIYEGLLEYQPRIAAEDMVIVSRKKKETIEPKAKHPNRDVAYPAATVYLLTDKGKRKSTGSYYTPDYIVRYIVENTLAPLCEGKSVDEILSLKILDPATGSGHFLVGVVDYLAEELVTHPQAPSISDDSDTEIAYWRRRVIESCVYGVDVNPMAVELAKLSLWLHTVAKGEPLSFLDHHIRCGNSLIGAQIRDLSHLPTLKQSRRKKVEEQTEFAMEFEFTQTVATAIGHYLLIEEMESRTADQIHAKEHELDIAQTMLRYHKGVANLWTSIYFGNDVSRSAYHQALNVLRSKKTVDLENLLCYRRAQKIAAEKRFFHWEIEFPEVFRDKYGREKDNPGFDAVVGNPPYVRSIRLKEVDLPVWSYYTTVYRTASAREFDIYLCFAEHGLEALKSDGRLGMILPNKWFTTRVGETIRSLLAAKQAVEQIVDFGHFQVFEGTTTYTCLLFLSGSPCDGIHVNVLQSVDGSVDPLPSIRGQWQTGEKSSEALDADSWTFALGPVAFLLEKLRGLSALSDIATVFSGVGTRADSVFFMQREGNRLYSRSLSRWVEIEDGAMRPALTGRDIDPYFYETENHLLFPYRLIADKAVLIPVEEMEAKYPLAWAYLNDATNREFLEQRDRGKYKNRSNWYCYSYPRNMHLQDLSKIVLPDVAGRAEFACDFEGRHIIDTAYAIRPKKEVEVSQLALTAILNSSLMTFFLKQTGTDLRGGYFRMKTAYLNPFPVPRINFITPDDERDRQLEKAVKLYEFCLSKGSTDCVLGFVKYHLSAEPERSDVVHDLLAFLAEQMIEMNKAKREEIRGFLRWLERAIEAEIDTLKNKTALQTYYNLGLSELIGVLKKNRRAIGVDPSGRDFQELLEREFTASHDKLTPLLARLQKTDELIEQVVYQLYGLTDEEIAVVEGKV